MIVQIVTRVVRYVTLYVHMYNVRTCVRRDVHVIIVLATNYCVRTYMYIRHRWRIIGHTHAEIHAAYNVHAHTHVRTY